MLNITHINLKLLLQKLLPIKITEQATAYITYCQILYHTSPFLEYSKTFPTIALTISIFDIAKMSPISLRT